MKQVIDNLNLKQIFSKKAFSAWRNDIDLQIVREYQKNPKSMFLLWTDFDEN